MPVGTVPLPETIIPKLKTHLDAVINLHDRDIDSGYASASCSPLSQFHNRKIFNVDGSKGLNPASL